ncbi:MAG: uroporphyrinogen decarboxylase family protein [Oscillospiraceae bacterium]|nr:uroporphyrinogen decarboxylase family protein [Oscillospiraceae bacterium]
MLTIRQNFLETIRGGNPDRFVNQYEFLSMVRGDPITGQSPRCTPGGGPVVDAWGVTKNWPAGLPGQFPVHDYEHRVVKDITKWKETVKMPRTDFPDEAWAAYEAAAAAIDREQYFVSTSIAPGIFEQVHYLMSIEEALVAFYTNPDEMHELVDYITEYELKLAEQLCKHAHPDAVFHHDDWGSHNSSFLSPEMFEEFFVPAYKKVYGYYKEHGVQIIVHHSDSYAANLVPAMIEMGIDVFQGCVTTNNVPELVKKYGGKIAFMGDINNGVCDVADWTPELIEREVRRACETNGKHYFIPCLTMGGPMSTYPGVYECATEMINKMSKEMF